MDVAGPGEGRRHQRAETIRSIGHIKRLRLQQNSRSEMVLKSRERAVENAESEPAVNSLRSRPWTTWCIYGGPTTRVTAVAPSMAPQAASVFSESERLARALSTPLGRPGWSMNEGERRPPRPEAVPQHPIGVGPCGGVAPPRPMHYLRSRIESRQGHRGDHVQYRRCPFPDTLRCPRRIAVSQTKPVLLRERCGSAFGSTHEGGATPPATEDVARTPVDVCAWQGRRSPLAAFGG